MEYTGRIVYIGDIETVGKNAIEKRVVALEEVSDKEYKGGLAFDLVKDKVSLIDKYSLGDVVTVYLNVKTNYYEPKKTYYNSINAWKIEGDVSKEVDTDSILPF